MTYYTSKPSTREFTDGHFLSVEATISESLVDLLAPGLQVS
jgi:hypothetical protein